MKRLAPIVALAALALALAAAPAALPAEGGDEQESAAAEPGLTPAQRKELAALIEQLGHEEWEKRDQASTRIEAFGKAALPALREATESTDQEVVERARTLIAKLDPPPGRGPRAGAPRIMRIGAGGNAIFVARAFAAGGRAAKVRTVADENGTVTIAEGADGITVTVTPAGEDAKPMTYSAKDRDEFKKKHKEAYEKYLATDEEKKAAAEAAAKAKKEEEKEEGKKADAPGTGQ